MHELKQLVKDSDLEDKFIFTGYAERVESYISDFDIFFNNHYSYFIWKSFLTISSTFLGLLLSAIFDTSEKVLAVVPIVLIPQIMLAGLVAKIGSKTVEFVSYMTFTRWGIEGFGNIQGDIVTDLSLIHISEPTRPY